MKRESDFGRWRFENKFKPMMKNVLVEDKELARVFTKSVKDLFNEFVAKRDDLTEIFPKFTRDYRKTTGKRESGWKRRNGSASITKQKNSSLRGVIYEGAIGKFCESHDLFENIRVPIPYFDKRRQIEADYEPDFWFNFHGLNIPVEFKTFAKQNMVGPKIKKGVAQSRRYGHLSFLTHNNPNKISALIVCCPEERLYSCAIVGQRADSKLG